MCPALPLAQNPAQFSPQRQKNLLCPNGAKNASSLSRRLAVLEIVHINKPFAAMN
jgi:hypothetical protein